MRKRCCPHRAYVLTYKTKSHKENEQAFNGLIGNGGALKKTGPERAHGYEMLGVGSSGVGIQGGDI